MSEEEASKQGSDLVTTPEAFFARPEAQHRVAEAALSYTGDVVRTANFFELPGAQAILLEQLNDDSLDNEGEPVGWQACFRQDLPGALVRITKTVRDYCDHQLAEKMRTDAELAKTVGDLGEVYGYLEGTDDIETQRGPVTRNDLIITKTVAAIVSIAAYEKLVSASKFSDDAKLRLRELEPRPAERVVTYAESERERILLERQRKMGGMASQVFDGSQGVSAELMDKLITSLARPESGGLNTVLKDYQAIAQADREERAVAGLDKNGEPLTRRGKTRSRYVPPGVGSLTKDWLRPILSGEPASDHEQPENGSDIRPEVVKVDRETSPADPDDPSKTRPETHTGGGMGKPPILETIVDEERSYQPPEISSIPLSKRIKQPTSSGAKG